jgi:hypothetical protein
MCAAIRDVTRKINTRQSWVDDDLLLERAGRSCVPIPADACIFQRCEISIRVCSDRIGGIRLAGWLFQRRTVSG